MKVIKEGQLQFTFKERWRASQFDRWSFYRKQFQKIGRVENVCGKCNARSNQGIKAIDILAIQPGSCCWCIEIKDYRQNARTKSIDLADEVAIKIRDSLAAIFAAAARANEPAEKSMAQDSIACPRIRIVLHLEQPATPSSLFPRAIDPAKVRQRMKQLLKSIDPHPLVVDTSSANMVPWSVR